MKIPSINVVARTLKSGKKSYFLDYRVNGVRKLEKAGNTKADAELFKSKIMNEFKESKYKVSISKVNLDTLLKRYLDSKKLYIAKKTHHRYENLTTAVTGFFNQYFKTFAMNADTLPSSYVLKFMEYVSQSNKIQEMSIQLKKDSFDLGSKTQDQIKKFSYLLYLVIALSLVNIFLKFMN